MYKIEFKTKEESKQIQELLFQLGYEWKYRNIGKKFHDTGYEVCFLYAQDGCITTGYKSQEGRNYFENKSDECEKITLPQLKDLVVFQRNDIKDANWETEGGDQIYKDSKGKSYIYRFTGWGELQKHEMRQAMWEIPQLKYPNLISRTEALKALSEGKEVEYFKEEWLDVNRLSVRDLTSENTSYQFRIKPELKKVTLSLVKPKRIDVDPVTGAVGLIYEDNKVAREVYEYLREQFNLHGV